MRQIYLKKKIDLVNDTHAREVDYWKRAAWGNKNEDERKQLTDLAPLRVFLACKDPVKGGVENIHEIFFHLGNSYSPYTEEQAFIEDIQQDDRF